MARKRNPQRVLNNCLWLPTLLGWPNGPSAEAQERCIEKAFGGRSSNVGAQNSYTQPKALVKTVETGASSIEKEAMVSTALFFLGIALLIATAYGVSKLIPD